MNCNTLPEAGVLAETVVHLYQRLMRVATEDCSIYEKTKETLLATLDTAGIDAREKAKVTTEVLTSMVAGLSAQSLEAAITMSKTDIEMPYTLAKLCLEAEMVEAQVKLTDAQIKLTEAQIKKIDAEIKDMEWAKNLRIAQGWLFQAQLHRDYGVIPNALTYKHETLLNLDYDEDYGSKVAEIAQTKAATYVAYATSWRNNGEVYPEVEKSGILKGAAATNTGLVYQQTRVAERQVGGYDDNMRQHAANSSAAFLAMLMGSDADIPAATIAQYTGKWSKAVDWLNGGNV